MIGWEKHVLDLSLGMPIPAAGNIKSGWVTLDTWTKAEAEALKLVGPATLYGHVGLDLGDVNAPGDVVLTFPKDIKTQWVRVGGDLTQREPHPIGVAQKSSAASSGPEYLTLDDFPLKWQIWQTGGVLTVRKIITVIDTPDSRLAERLAPR